MVESCDTLLVVAAPAEAAAVLRGFGIDAAPPQVGACCRLQAGVLLGRCGVGPVPAGLGAAGLLARTKPDRVVNVGVAGAYARESEPSAEIGEAVLATSSLLADHGAMTPAGFVELADMGFGPAAGTAWHAAAPGLAVALEPLADRRGPIATVGTVSGTEALARALAERTGAVAEAMEGAAVALACFQSGVPFAELRVISNRVGDRSLHPWRLDDALARLGELAPRIVQAESSDNTGS